MLNRDEIAAMLGVSREVLRKTVEAKPDFPRPALRLSRKTVRWDRVDIERWMRGGADPEPIELAPAPEPVLAPPKVALYRHYDAAGTLLYIGISLKPIRRLETHGHHSSWAASIARIEVEWLGTQEAAAAAEVMAIRNERPAHNVVHNQWRVHTLC